MNRKARHLALIREHYRRNEPVTVAASQTYEELRLLSREELARRAGFDAPRQQLIATLINDGGTAAREEASMAPSTTIPTAESLAEQVGAQAFSADKAPYARLVTEAGTLAYCSSRKDGVLLDFATAAVEGAPKRFQAHLSAHGNRTTMRVTAKNEKAANDLLAWVAKQIG